MPSQEEEISIQGRRCDTCTHPVSRIVLICLSWTPFCLLTCGTALMRWSALASSVFGEDCARSLFVFLLAGRRKAVMDRTQAAE